LSSKNLGEDHHSTVPSANKYTPQTPGIPTPIQHIPYLHPPSTPYHHSLASPCQMESPHIGTQEGESREKQEPKHLQHREFSRKRGNRRLVNDN